MNTKMIDIRGRKIKSGDTVRIYQRAQSSFEFYTCKDKKELEESIEWMNTLYGDNEYYPKGRYTLKQFIGNEYLVYLNGRPFGINNPEYIYEKTVYMMSSDHDVPEMNIKEGDKIPCFGGEGYAAGVFRYKANNMEIL